MSDPFARAYVTAGDPYVAADGMALNNTDGATISSYRANYGEDAAIVYGEVRNADLLAAGQAIMTPQGVISLSNARFAVQKAGYNGPTDPSSIASAYQMLQSPAPQTVPHPAQTAQASAQVGGLSLSGGIGGIPRPLLYLGVGLLAYELLFSGRRRLL